MLANEDGEASDVPGVAGTLLDHFVGCIGDKGDAVCLFDLYSGIGTTTFLGQRLLLDDKVRDDFVDFVAAHS